eukprot:COSAG02_NODE_48700_length_332_cov_0.562232_1_plen_47_part_01
MTSFAEDMQVDMRSTEKLLEQLTAAAPTSDFFSSRRRHTRWNLVTGV